VTATLDSSALSGVGSDFTNNKQGGYTTAGRIVSGQVGLNDVAIPPVATTMTQQVYTVSDISGDAWNYNTAVGSGSLSLAAASPTIIGTEVNGLSGFALETGPVADQSFAGGSAAITPALYIGQGDYSTILD